MVAAIGRSTDPSTVKKRMDVPVSEGKASIRYNNPGAQYPSARAARFGQIGYGKIGGGHLIARFPDPVNGAAANFDLLFRNYVGMRMGPAGKKWTGSYGFGIPGYPDDTILTKEMLNDPKLAIAIMKAIAGREAGKKNTLSEEQWEQAHDMFRAGSADAYLDGKPLEEHPNGGTEKGPTGAGLLRRAREHIGERYVNVQVPKDDSNWTGPWDCAEFMSWLVFQEAKLLYGCTDDNAKPSQAEAYTGAWRDDVERKGTRVSVKEAASTVGGILLRYPPSPGAMGHIVLCDGEGGTVEAMDKKHGVVAGTVHGRRWDTGVLIPQITYDGDDGVDPRPPAEIYRRNEPNMDSGVIRRIQESLASKGFFNRNEIDGEFERSTEDAVIAFQRSADLVVDGEVGPDTAGALGISLKPGKPDDVVEPKGGQEPIGKATDPLLGIAISLLPSLARFLIGDKAGAVAGVVKKLVTEFAGTSDPARAQQKLQDDQSAKAMLTLQLARIEAEEEEMRQKRRLEEVKEENRAAAEKRKVELDELRARIEDTQGARATFAALALARNPMSWGAPVVSAIVTAGFFGILAILIMAPDITKDQGIIQIINISVGALAAAFATVVGFWVGSSEGSRNKDDQIRLQTAQVNQVSTAAMESQTKVNQVMQTLAEQPKRAETVTIVTKPVGETPKPSTAIERCVDVVLNFETDEALKKMPREKAREVYRTNYWNVLRCDDLPAGVDLVVFDFGVVGGPPASANVLQKVVGAEADGSVGSATISASKGMAPQDIVMRMSELRLKYHRDRNELSDDLIKRITAVKEEAQRMIAAASAAAV